MNPRSQRLLDRFYSGDAYDGTLRFYRGVRALVQPGCHLLDLGAGPGHAWSEREDHLRNFRGPLCHVCGCDPDPAVLQNPRLDLARVMGGDEIPFPSDTFDLIFADCVLEHVANPLALLAEIRRVLRPGGYFLFRTPNICHYVAFFACLLPHRFHHQFANRLRSLDADAPDPYPTHYRMNRRGRLSRLARRAGLQVAALEMVETQPSYLVFHPIPLLAGIAYERLVNRFTILQGMRCSISGKLRKPPAPPAPEI